MSRPVEVLERIAGSNEAVFALDGNDLVILWNKACERLLGRQAYQVLGRRCYDVLCGHDVHGNRYCGASCPITSQARQHPNEEMHTFLLDVPVTGGGTRRIATTPFAISGGHPSLATIVHVLRDPEQQASTLEHELADAVAETPAAEKSRRTAPGQVAALTTREQEILRALARGLSTEAIASELFISPVTVRNHVARILSKLDVHTKLAAVAFAYRNGLVANERAQLPAMPSGPAPAPRAPAKTPGRRKAARRPASRAR